MEDSSYDFLSPLLRPGGQVEDILISVLAGSVAAQGGVGLVKIFHVLLVLQAAPALGHIVLVGLPQSVMQHRLDAGFQGLAVLPLGGQALCRPAPQGRYGRRQQAAGPLHPIGRNRLPHGLFPAPLLEQLVDVNAAAGAQHEIGRASCRERV